MNDIRNHGEYISDFGGTFSRIASIERAKAAELIKASPYVDTSRVTENGWKDPYLIMNKGFVLVRAWAAPGMVQAVYCHDGNYTLWQAPEVLACKALGLKSLKELEVPK